MVSKIRSAGFLCVAVVVLLVAVSVPALAMEKPKDLLDKAINQLTAQTQNAKVKVMNNTGGIGLPSRKIGQRAEKSSMSPAGRCCNSNMNVIREASIRLREMLQVLRYELRTLDRKQGAGTIREMNIYLDEVDLRVRQFAGTGEKNLAVDFLEMAQHAVTQLRQSKTELDACCSDLLPKMPVKPVKAES